MINFFNFIDNIANKMYVYPIKTLVFIIVLNMLYYSTEDLFVGIFVFFIWSIMIEAYVTSRIARKRSNISSMDIMFNTSLFDIKIFLIICVSSMLHTTLINFANSFFVILIAKLIVSIIITLGYIIILYKQI